MTPPKAGSDDSHPLPEALQAYFTGPEIAYQPEGWRWHTHRGWPRQPDWYVLLRASKAHNSVRYQFLSVRVEDGKRRDCKSLWYTPDEAVGVWARCLLEERSVWEPD